MRTIQVSIAQLPRLVPHVWQAQRCLAIVIDVLRFTTTACRALQAGANSIAVEGEIEQARALATRIGDAALLCGERNCIKIDGFALGNSPLEYLPERIGARDLVFSTTNGTLAVLTVANAEYLALGSFLNRRALAEWVRSLIAENRIDRIEIVCAGTDSQIAAEDVLAAGALASLIRPRLSHSSLASSSVSGPSPTYDWELNDSAAIAVGWWENWASCQLDVGETVNLIDLFAQSLGGKNLVQAGFADDLVVAAELDQLNAIPVRVSAPWVKFTLLGS